MINVTEAKTAELVAFYNEHAAKPVKKFSDRKTAERRVQQLIDSLEQTKIPFEEETSNECPDCGIDLANSGYKAKDGKKACPYCDAEVEAHVEKETEECPACGIDMLENGYDLKDGKMVCLGCGHGGETDRKRSEAIAKSWDNPEVAAKRKKRHAVRVDGVEYRSVRQAFVALDLPLNVHIKFRMELKAAGKLEEFGMQWEIVDSES